MWQNDTDQKGGDRPTEAEASGDDLGAPFSFVGPLLRAHLLATRKRMAVLPAAVVRSPMGTSRMRIQVHGEAVDAAISFCRASLELLFSALCWAQFLPVFTLQGSTAFVKRTRSQPRPRGCSKSLGHCPNKQKLRFPALPETAVSACEVVRSLCGL